MSTYRKFARDIGITGLTQITLALRGFIILPIISKMLGADGFGLWAQVIVTLGIAEFLYEMGLANALVRFLAGEKDKGEIQEGFYSILCTVLACSLVLAAIVALLAPVLSDAVFDGQGKTTIRIAAMVIPFAAVFQICSRYFLTFRQVWTYSILNMIRYFGEIGLIAGLVASGFGVNAAVLSLVIAVFIAGVAAFILVVRNIGIKRPHFKNLKSYLTFGLPIVPLLFFGWITQLSDRYVIGACLDITRVGIYSAAYSLCSVQGWIHQPVVRILQPTVSKSFDEGNIIEVQDYLRRSLKYVLLIAIPATVGLSILGKGLLLVFTTSEIASDGYLVIPLVAVSQLMVQVYAITGWQVLMLVKKTSVLAIAMGVVAVVNLGLNLVLVPRHGIMAAAWTTLLAYFIYTIIILWYSHREMALNLFDWKAILKSLAAAGVMAGVILSINPTRIWEVILVIGMGVVIYGAVLLLLKGLSKDEISFFTSLVRK